MTVQYIIIGIVVALSVAYAAYCIMKSVRQNLRCDNIGCAGCPFYDGCNRKRKIPRNNKRTPRA